MKKYVFILILILCQYSVQAGQFYEHKFIADSAFKKFIFNNQLETFFADTLHFPLFTVGNYPAPLTAGDSLVTYYPGMFGIPGLNQVVYSYGDFTGLAGDHSVDFIQLYLLLRDTAAFNYLAKNPSYQKLGKELESALQSHRKAIHKGKREGGFFSIPYVAIANEDKSHFQHPPDSFREMLGLIDTGLINTVVRFDLTPAPDSPSNKKPCCKDNPNSFDCIRKHIDALLLKLNNTSKYALLHLWAEEEIRASALYFNMHDTARFINYFKAGLVMNAFADHFLEDAFASGHMAVQRSNCGLDDKGTHDFYNRIGLNVENSLSPPERWRSYGDDHYDSATYKHAIDANLQSLNEVWGWFNKHRLAAASGKFAHAHIVDLRQHPEKQGLWADDILSSFAAYKYMPIPLDKHKYEDSIKLKHGSKSGIYGELNFASQFLPGRFFDNYRVGAAFGFIGYNVVKPKDGLAAFGRSIESVLWAGGSLNYNYYRQHAVDEHRVYVAANTTFIEYIAFDAGIGCSVLNARALAYEYLAAGGEFKSLKCRLAPSLKYFVEFEHHHPTPAMGLKLGLRIY